MPAALKPARPLRLPAGLRREDVIMSMAQSALRHAEEAPELQSEILGQAAINFAQMAAKPPHVKEAPALRTLANHFAQLAMTPQPTTDDFREILEEHAEAGREDVQNDLELTARANALHDQTYGSNRVSIAPATWGRGATLGRSGKFKFNPTQEEIRNGVAQSATLAFWQGEPHEACAITVDVNLLEYLGNALDTPYSAAPPSRPQARLYGNVVYGSDGSVTQVKFDVGRGTRFTVVGNYVSVVVGMDPVEGPAAEISVGASIGAFAAPSTAPVFMTGYLALVNGEEGTLKIPSHGVQICPIQTNAITGSFWVYLYGVTGGLPVSIVSYPVGTLAVSPIPIPGDVGYVGIVNNTGAPCKVRVPFQLSM